ncbi:MAG: polysaccharide biosynthesis tyrosine autokinase [Bryobacterales bacterium]|nr:polysaccharide biosynthesis tyrosine autokinase [Bryobacterales bacterium]
MIAAGTLLGALLGSLSVALQPAMYQAKTVLDIRSLNENFLSSEAGTGTSQSVLPESFIQTEIKILSSQSIRDRALASIPGSKPSRRGGAAAPPPASTLFRPAPASYDAIIADAGRRIKVKALGNTRIVEISCQAKDGQVAATVCNALAQTYIANNLDSRHHSANETSQWLQSQLNDTRQRLAQEERQLADAGSSVDFGTDGPVQSKLRQLQTELARMQLERWGKESAYLIADNSDVNSMPPDLDSGSVRQYRLQLADLRRHRTQLLATMTPEHAAVRENALQIEDLERLIQREKEGLMKRLRSDLELTLRREAMVSVEYDKEAAKAVSLNDKAIRYNMLKRNVDSDRHLYQTLLQRVGEVGIAAAMRTSTITVVDPATAPMEPYSPNGKFNLAVGILGGSFLSVVLAIVRMRNNHAIVAPGETPIYLQLRELGVVPLLKGPGRGLRLRFRRQQKVDEIALDSTITAEQVPALQQEVRSLLVPQMSSRSVALATWLHIPEMAEAIFGAMNSILLSTKPAKAGRVTVLTSPEAGDGKTTVSVNLAIAMAQVGRRVVLLEGDLRQPRLHAILDTPVDSGGLSSILRSDGALNYEEDVPKILVQTAIPGLWLIPSRPMRQGVARTLHSQKMRDLITELATRFDEVVIDSPPVLVISDARVLGAMADGVLLVVRSGKTAREAALAAYDALLQDGTRVLGTILNAWHHKASHTSRNYSSYLRAAS